jgi:hypothetical protein
MSKGENCKFGLVIPIQLLLLALVVCYYLYKRTMVLADTSRQLLSKSSQLISLTDEIYKYLHIHSNVCIVKYFFCQQVIYRLFFVIIVGWGSRESFETIRKTAGYKTV